MYCLDKCEMSAILTNHIYLLILFIFNCGNDPWLVNYIYAGQTVGTHLDLLDLYDQTCMKPYWEM